MNIKISKSDWMRIGSEMGWTKGAFSAADAPPATVEPEPPTAGGEGGAPEEPAADDGCRQIVERVNTLASRAKRIDMGRDTEIAKVLAFWTKEMAQALHPTGGVDQTKEPSSREGFRSDERALNSLLKAMDEFKRWVSEETSCGEEKKSAVMKATNMAMEFCEKQMRLVAKYNRIGRRVI